MQLTFYFGGVLSYTIPVESCCFISLNFTNIAVITSILTLSIRIIGRIYPEFMIVQTSLDNRDITFQEILYYLQVTCVYAHFIYALL